MTAPKRLRWCLGAAALLSACAGQTRPGASPSNDSLLQRMLVAEDARGKGADGIAPLLEGAHGRDTTLRRVAIRGLGRLQQPGVTNELIPALDDPLPAIRAEAANALAQSVQSTPAAARATDDARTALIARLGREEDPEVVGALAASLGRLPLDSTRVRKTVNGLLEAVANANGGKRGALQAVLEARGEREGMAAVDAMKKSWHFELMPPPVARGVIAGVYSLARSRANRQVLAQDTELRTGLETGLRYTSDAHISNLAKLAIAAVNGGGGAPAPVNGVPLDGCKKLEKAAHNPDTRAALAALDSLGRPCGDIGIAYADTLRAWASTLDPRDVPRKFGSVSWHAAAHALLSLSTVRPEIADEMLPPFMAHPNPFVREYAARVAAVFDDSALLRLSTDRDGNVRATAIAGLAKLRKHLYDRVFIAALEARQYQVVLAATRALAGSTDAAAVSALLRALDRLSAERRENSRDERVAILARLAELGTPFEVRRLRRYLADFDTTVAAKSASLLTQWTGNPVLADPHPLPIRPEPLAGVFRARDMQLRITMAKSSGGGTILVRLFTDETPATIARIVRLARAHYYDGLTFHRIVPGFVIQGGSPGANEQVGDAAFMRDELGMRSHDRGTLGISTRGRDTGDAQFFINLVDNPRLDHDYTVFGQVLSGMEVVDQILEGDVMARVEVIGGKIPR
ncbi:MAG: peptidylprolyl isomerase [Gemmatimonadales bacterium]